MKNDYMSRLRRWARWYLGAEEAVEVIADYEEMAAGRFNAELERDLGAPRAAMGALMDKTAFVMTTILLTAAKFLNLEFVGTYEFVPYTAAWAIAAAVGLACTIWSLLC